VYGDTVLGDTMLGDIVLGETVYGDSVYGDTVLGDIVLGDTVMGGGVVTGGGVLTGGVGVCGAIHDRSTSELLTAVAASPVGGLPCAAKAGVWCPPLAAELAETGTAPRMATRRIPALRLIKPLDSTRNTSPVWRHTAVPLHGIIRSAEPGKRNGVQ
jgi:hypothetical protein